MERTLYRNLAALRAGELIPFEGMQLRMVPGKEYGDSLVPGDTYYACRNTEQLFTARTVDQVNRWVHPSEVGYSFDFAECVGVELVEV